MTNYYSRRDFLQNSLAAMASLALFPRDAFGQSLTVGPEPHFFIELFINGGWDTRYLVDSRPLAFRAKNLMHDYATAEPERIVSRNGQGLWLSPSAKSLKEHLADCSILNGVIMQHEGPDGHAPVTNSWFTGSQSGGLCFLPLFNQAALKKASIDVFSLGANFAKPFSNLSQMPQLSFGTSAKLNSMSPLVSTPALSFARARMDEISKEGGAISSAARAMGRSLDKAPELVDRLRTLTPPPVEGVSRHDRLLSTLHFALDSFKKEVAQGALIATDNAGEFSIDLHSGSSAKEMPQRMKNISDLIAAYIKTLKDTAFNETKSFFDVCTLVVHSEFSRTLLQRSSPIDESGTDHNALSNTFILAGKGIEKGLILGESDLQQVDEVLDAAHLNRDAARVKLMGRPFDFSAQATHRRPQSEFRPQNYMLSQNVVNTLLHLFNVNDKYFRKIVRNGENAKIVSAALSSSR